MIKEIDLEEIIDREDIIFIDVRSEKEFDEDTIPGAVNLPILKNKEREYVGYLYKQVDKEKAKELGLKYASEKLPDLYKRAKQIVDSDKKIALFCYRGGMRSSSVANVLNIMGIDNYLIKGGYKSYRKKVVEDLKKYENEFNYIVLHGYTGVGKTKILNKLEDINEPIIDLEGLANNSGSVFGDIAFKEVSSTQKRFESLLLKNLKSINRNYVVLESESKRIGRIMLPDFLYENMQNGYHVLIETNLDNRIENILDDYVGKTNFNKNRLISAVEKLRKRLGNDIVDKLIKNIENNDYKPTIKTLMLDYYDPLYKYSIDKVDNYDKIIRYDTLDEAVKEVKKFSKTV
ncbi:MAG: tRNA 2-selenouridine(34) synthase MnmH [Firmicutes bacterium]|nr:tRNA 2-selenouridine(34) synthase MnmH [Bacillota bacterium]